MTPPQSHLAGARGSGRSRAAFTLLEVALAAFVLALGIMSSIIVLQRGFQALDTARHLTAATQIMQSEMERLRLLNWTQLGQLQASGSTVVPPDPAQAANQITCTRTIEDYKPDMKQIVVTAAWSGYDGRPHTACLVTRYCRDGLNDYYYTIR